MTATMTAPRRAGRPRFAAPYAQRREWYRRLREAVVIAYGNNWGPGMLTTLDGDVVHVDSFLDAASP